MKIEKRVYISKKLKYKYAKGKSKKYVQEKQICEIAIKNIKSAKIFKVGNEKRKNIAKKIPSRKDNLKKKYLSKNNNKPEDKKIINITKGMKEK